MAYTLTQLASDNFNRANEEPLSPAHWTTIPANTDLAIISHKCVSGAANNGEEIYTGVSFPNDQYFSITISSIVSIPVVAYNFFGQVRSSLGLTAGYQFTLVANGDGSASLNLSDEPNEDNYLTYLVPSPKVGDVITIGTIGTTIFAEYNGVEVLSFTDAQYASGELGFGLFYDQTQTDTSVSLFAAGSVSNPLPPPPPYSVPDCRNYGHFPNASRSVNGTLIYDVQTSSNSSVPGTDSRVSKPVASGTYPQNSRSPGKYGPNNN